MNAVYAYSGTQIFLDFMAEMSQPRNFLKSMWGSQFFIYACYMLYGLFMYGYQGQYVQNPSYLGISPYSWSTVGNSLAMVTAIIAAALYGNIGLKSKPPTKHPCSPFTDIFTSLLQQHRRPTLQSPTPIHQIRKMDLGSNSPDLLVHRLRHRRRHPRLLWLRWLCFCPLRHAVHILVPSAPSRWTHGADERHWTQRGLRSCHRTPHSD